MIKQMLASYGDGVVTIYDVSDDGGTSGGAAQETLTPKETLRYMERTVGIRRNYAALQANVVVSMVIRCPRRRNISTQDIAKPNDGEYYRIVQVQYPESVKPESMDLSLEIIEGKYNDER